MSAYKISNSASLPTVFDQIRQSTLTYNTNQSVTYLRSQMNTSSPPHTSSNRVSKAMKGKRVHACERPGCDKVFTRAEHRRRHELTHDPKKQYPCPYEGCEKAFHRADYLNQHLSRHGSSKPNPPKSNAHGKILSSCSSAQQQLPAKPALSPPLLQVEPPYSTAWGSIDSSISSSFSRDLSLSPISVEEHPSPYSYTGETCSSPLPNDSFTNPHYPSSGIPVEMASAIDQYLRSILKPEAFANFQQPMNPAIWSPEVEIDPTLMKLESQDQLPLYSWPAANNLPYETHTTQ